VQPPFRGFRNGRAESWLRQNARPAKWVSGWDTFSASKRLSGGASGKAG
jgi:hypothetical protein